MATHQCRVYEYIRDDIMRPYPEGIGNVEGRARAQEHARLMWAAYYQDIPFAPIVAVVFTKSIEEADAYVKQAEEATL